MTIENVLGTPCRMWEFDGIADTRAEACHRAAALFSHGASSATVYETPLHHFAILYVGSHDL